MAYRNPEIFKFREAQEVRRWRAMGASCRTVQPQKVGKGWAFSAQLGTSTSLVTEPMGVYFDKNL